MADNPLLGLILSQLSGQQQSNNQMQQADPTQMIVPLIHAHVSQQKQLATDEQMRNILEHNKHLDFVRRLMNPRMYPAIDNPDGSYSSHLMSSAEVDGNNIAYPMIVYDRRANKLNKLTPKDAFSYALKTGEYISFPTPEAAEQFATKYKRGGVTNMFTDVRPSRDIQRSNP